VRRPSPFHSPRLVGIPGGIIRCGELCLLIWDKALPRCCDSSTVAPVVAFSVGDKKIIPPIITAIAVASTCRHEFPPPK
jgi:hypothetical protein